MKIKNRVLEKLAYTSVNADSCLFKMVRSGGRVEVPDFCRRPGLHGNCVKRPDFDSGTAACNHQLPSSPAAWRAKSNHLPSHPAGRANLLGKPDAQGIRDDGRLWRPDTGNGSSRSTCEHRT